VTAPQSPLGAAPAAVPFFDRSAQHRAIEGERADRLDRVAEAIVGYFTEGTV
jgi:hypothetical protein